jgi:hypothetical protein
MNENAPFFVSDMSLRELCGCLGKSFSVSTGMMVVVVEEDEVVE